MLMRPKNDFFSKISLSLKCFLWPSYYEQDISKDIPLVLVYVYFVVSCFYPSAKSKAKKKVHFMV